MPIQKCIHIRANSLLLVILPGMPARLAQIEVVHIPPASRCRQGRISELFAPGDSVLPDPVDAIGIAPRARGVRSGLAQSSPHKSPAPVGVAAFFLQWSIPGLKIGLPVRILPKRHCPEPRSCWWHRGLRLSVTRSRSDFPSLFQILLQPVRSFGPEPS